MVKVFEGTKDEFMLDGYIKQVLDKTKQVMRQDWDMMFNIDGTEGAGKSVLAMQLAKYVDPDFSVDNIAFTPKQFKESILKAPKYTSVVYDEAYGGLGARNTMSQVNIAIVKMLAEVRFRNLFLLVVMPTYFDLDRYAALWRSRGLFHVYSDSNFKRGKVAFFNKERKKKLYVNGKKTYSYGKPRANFIATFTNHYTVDKNKYNAKKMESTSKTEDDTRLMALRTGKEIREGISMNLNRSDIGLSKTQIAAILSVSRMTIHNYLKAKGVEDDEE